MKLPDGGAVKTFHRLRVVEIKNHTELARVKASKTAVAVTLAAVQFIEAEIARCHPSWASALHKGAVVRLPTWGVVVHDIQVKSIGDLKDPQEVRRVADQILAENIFAWGNAAQIAYLTWLTTMNKAIDEGTI
ncbi:hypothetical protein IFM61606_04317 [Aspergillus udagawae]|nr:hypothetical protein IFM61606_04317 [Aspergillus udagawae]